VSTVATARHGHADDDALLVTTLGTIGSIFVVDFAILRFALVESRFAQLFLGSAIEQFARFACVRAVVEARALVSAHGTFYFVDFVV
jgi:hypothetical protein